MTGHPCTTGLKEIDYFISSQLLEREDSQKDYSEQLIKFRKMPTSMTVSYHDPSEDSEHVMKLDRDSIKIGIIHSLFKLTPEFDEVLEQVLRLTVK